MLDQDFMQLDDLVWDNFQGSYDHIVPAPDQQSRESAWSRGLHQKQRNNIKKRRFLNKTHQQQGKQHSIITTITGLAAAVAAASQQSLGSSTTFSNSSSEEEEGNSPADSWAGRFSGPMLQAWPSVAPVMWNEVINGADFSATKVGHQHQHQHQQYINNHTFSPSPMLSGTKSMSVKDDAEVESSLLGGVGGGGVYLSDALYSEDSVLSSSCHFTLGDVDPDNSDLALFGDVTDDGKVDYSWDNCLSDLEDVDNLLRWASFPGSAPNPGFGAVISSPDGTQWHDSASPPAVQPVNNLCKAKSPSTDCSATVKRKLDVRESTLDFVPVDTPLSLPLPEKVQDSSFKDSEFLSSNGYHRLQNGQVQEEQQSAQELGAQFNGRDCLHDEVMAGSVHMSKDNCNMATGMEIADSETGPASVSLTELDKVRMAQDQFPLSSSRALPGRYTDTESAHRARRKAVNRNRYEERNMRQLNHRKIVHGPTYGPQAPQMLQPMQLHLSPHAAHLHQPSPSPLHGYSVSPVALSPLQPMIRSTSSYVHAKYGAPVHLMPPVTPAVRVPGQNLFVGYRQPCAFPQPLPQQQQQQQQPQLRLPGEVPICPPASSPIMTPQEKLEKLRYLQQMQARIAVEQQQQQLIAQGVAPLDPSSLLNGHTQLPHTSPLSQPEVPANNVDVKLAVSENDMEPPLSAGQTNGDTTSDDEGGSLEAVVLEQLQRTMKSWQLETKLCLRDALYRLARSAMWRKTTGEGTSGEDPPNSSQASQDGDAMSSGLETSINSDPSSSSRGSRMNMGMEENQTNPIDRSIAHLLFNKTQSPPASVQYVPSSEGTPHLGPPQNNNVVGLSSISNWASMPHQMMQVGDRNQDMMTGIEMVPAPHLQSPISASPMSGLLDRVGPDTTEPLEHRTGMLSQLVTDRLQTGHLQGNHVVGNIISTGELPSQPCEGIESKQGILRTKAVMNPKQKDPSEIRNRLQQGKRLQHATGLKELSHLLNSGLDMDPAPLCKEENGLTQCGTPLLTSSGAAGKPLPSSLGKELTNNIGELNSPRIHAERRRRGK